MAPMGIATSSSSWAVWLQSPYSVVTYPVVVTVDVAVNSESRKPAASPPSLPDTMNAHAAIEATTPRYTRNSVERSSGFGSRLSAR